MLYTVPSQYYNSGYSILAAVNEASKATSSQEHTIIALLNIYTSLYRAFSEHALISQYREGTELQGFYQEFYGTSSLCIVPGHEPVYDSLHSGVKSEPCASAGCLWEYSFMSCNNYACCASGQIIKCPSHVATCTRL